MEKKFIILTSVSTGKPIIVSIDSIINLNSVKKGSYVVFGTDFDGVVVAESLSYIASFLSIVNRNAYTLPV